MLKPTNRLISFSSTLGLMLRNTSSGTSNLESLVLGLLDSLTRGINLGHETLSNETVLGLELENRLLVVVNEAESCGFSSSELGAESKENDKFGVCLVHASNNLLEFRFGDIARPGWMMSTIICLRESRGLRLNLRVFTTTA